MKREPLAEPSALHYSQMVESIGFSHHFEDFNTAIFSAVERLYDQLTIQQNEARIACSTCDPRFERLSKLLFALTPPCKAIERDELSNSEAHHYASALTDRLLAVLGCFAEEANESMLRQATLTPSQRKAFCLNAIDIDDWLDEPLSFAQIEVIFAQHGLWYRKTKTGFYIDIMSGGRAVSFYSLAELDTVEKMQHFLNY
jgi:hypothetical protein